MTEVTTTESSLVAAFPAVKAQALEDVAPFIPSVVSSSFRSFTDRSSDGSFGHTFFNLSQHDFHDLLLITSSHTLIRC